MKRIPLIILVLWAVSPFAQTSVQANVFNELNIPTTPRTAVLEQVEMGLESIAGNPAHLALSTDTEALYGQMFFQGSFRDIGVHALGITHKFNETNIALTLTMWDVSFLSVPVTVTAQDTIANKRNVVILGGSVSHTFTDYLSAGVTLKGARLIDRQQHEGQTVWKIDSKAIAIDAGISYILPDTGVRFGASVRNLGATFSQFSGEEVTCDPQECPEQEPTAHLPTAIRLSGSYTRSLARDLSLSAIASVGVLRKGSEQTQEGLNLAVEGSFRDLFFLRGGINTLDDEYFLNQWGMWSAGIGFKIPIDPVELRVDYAFRPSSTSNFDGAHLLSMGVGF